MAIKNKIKSALIYPVAVLVVAFVVLAVIMIFVIPAFEDVFKSFGADLPAPTLVVIAMSKFFVKYWYLIFGILGGGIYFFMQSWRRSMKMQKFMDRLLLQACRSSATWSTSRRSRAGRARCRRCSRPACRWSRRSTRSAARRATRSSPRRPRRSRRTSRPARR